MITKLNPIKTRLSASEKIVRLMECKARVLDTRSLATLWGIAQPSAKVEAFRFVRSGILKPIRRGLYAVVSRDPLPFHLANAFYQPSVISLETALNHWGAMIQSPQIVTSIADRSRHFQIASGEFLYRRVPETVLAVGVVKEDGVAIACVQKALMDYLYLGSKGLYSLDTGSLFLSQKTDWNRALHYIPLYPGRYQSRMRDILESMVRKAT